MLGVYFGRGIIQLSGSRARIVDTAGAAFNAVEKATGHNCATGPQDNYTHAKAEDTLKCTGEALKILLLPQP
jgi:hypothetical protein